MLFNIVMMHTNCGVATEASLGKLSKFFVLKIYRGYHSEWKEVANNTREFLVS